MMLYVSVYRPRGLGQPRAGFVAGEFGFRMVCGYRVEGCGFSDFGV